MKLRMPGYTTRVMLSFILLAALAGILAAGGTYRIGSSLKDAQAQFRHNKTHIRHGMVLHEAGERRRQAEILFLNSGGKRLYIERWRQADREFSHALKRLGSMGHYEPSRVLVDQIDSINKKVRGAWSKLTAAPSPPPRARINAVEDIERLEAVIARYNKAQVRLTSAADQAAISDTDWTVRATLMFSTLILGLAFIMALYVGNTLRRPLADLLAATQKITEGQLGHRIDLTRSDEIGALTAAFDEMSAKLYSQDNQIKGQLELVQRSNSLLQTYSRELEAKNKEMESFIYSVSHDLKAPLIAIHGFLAMLGDEFGDALPEKARFYLERVRANSHQMQTLIQQLLELSRAGQTGHLAPVATRQVAQQVIDDLRLQIETKAAQVKLCGDWPNIIAEPTGIKQALTNLVDNGLHYGHNGVPIKIQMGVDNEDGFWRFFVRDNGIGIDPDYQEKIFNMFERLSDAQERYEHGTGIGLAIVKKIAEGHGGTAGVESKPGEGSTFYFQVSKDLKPGDRTNLEVQV